MMDDLFDNDLFPRWYRSEERVSIPAVNIKELEDEYQVEVAAPGLEKDNFKIEVDNNMLTISSEFKEDSEDKKENFTRREFSYSSFNRSFSLPEEVNKDKIKANHKNGILTVHIPKVDEQKSKLRKMIKID
jgi:HSP20 family protein